MTLLFFFKPSHAAAVIPPPITNQGGWYTYNKNDPRPRPRSLKYSKHMTVDEIDTIKHWRKKEEEELNLILIHLRHGEYDWDD